MDNRPGIGDPVEVKMFERVKGEIWIPATVCHSSPQALGVAFSDGQRMMLEHRAGRYRRVRFPSPDGDTQVR